MAHQKLAISLERYMVLGHWAGKAGQTLANDTAIIENGKNLDKDSRRLLSPEEKPLSTPYARPIAAC
jgi:hypothetical protein